MILLWHKTQSILLHRKPQNACGKISASLPPYGLMMEITYWWKIPIVQKKLFINLLASLPKPV
jgi:hypothetical protein